MSYMLNGLVNKTKLNKTLSNSETAMTIHDHFATFMFKLDRALGHPINRIGVNAPAGCATRE